MPFLVFSNKLSFHNSYKNNQFVNVIASTLDKRDPILILTSMDTNNRTSNILEKITKPCIYHIAKSTDENPKIAWLIRDLKLKPPHSKLKSYPQTRYFLTKFYLQFQIMHHRATSSH